MRKLLILVACASIAACDPDGYQMRYSNMKREYPVSTKIERLEDQDPNPILWIRAVKRLEINRSEEGVVELRYACPCAVSTADGGIGTIPEGPFVLVLAAGAQYDVFDGEVAHRFPAPKTNYSKDQ